MKINKIKYLSLIMLLALFISCDDLLDLSPQTQKTPEVAFSTFAGVVEATNGTYAPLYSSSWYGRGFIITSELKGGNAKLSPINTGRFRNEYTWTNNDSYTSNVYALAYKTITRASNVLKYAQELNDPTMTENEKALVPHLLGECHFLRALAYFDLVRMYSQPYTSEPQSMGVPIVTVPDVSELPSRATVTEVYNQINEDLTTAIDLLNTYSRVSSGSSAAFANKYAAYALKAKVALYMGEWQIAADNANIVINNGGYTLYSAANYSTVWGKNAQSEVIFEVFGKDGQAFFPGYDDIGIILSPSGYGDICATSNLTNLFEAGDVRSDLFNDYGYTGYLWPTKYPGKSKLQENNIPVLRLSEMFLIRAEAALNGASGYDALSDYNTIRVNRGLAMAGSVTLNEVYNERRRELCFEGNQLWDLSRTGRGLNRDESEINITETENIDISFPDYRWAMPLPVNEVTVNKNLVQNPGY